MATIQNNILLQGISGMFGRHIVFKTMRGKTIMAQRPAPPARQSESQKTNRSKFREASAWAQQILKDPVKKEYYRQKAKKLKLPNAYTAAITDFMRKPTVVKTHTGKDTTDWAIHKRHFALKKVEVVIVKDAVTEVRPVVKNSYDSEWHFRLSKQDMMHEVSVHITDDTGNTFVLNMNP